MKNMRIPLLIVLGVAIIGIIFGSFFDLNISKAIASADNKLGLTISAIGPTIGFAGVAMMGGTFIRFALKGDYKLWQKILFWVLAVACYGVSVYYPAGEYFGINGFYGSASKWVGYLIVFLPEAGAMVLGYFLFKDCENKNMWIIFTIVIALLVIALLGVIPALKDLIHRPRFRLIVAEGVEFHNWWEPCKNYKELIELYGTAKDNFKSYPSGHTAEASIFLVTTLFLPLAGKKFEKLQRPLFIFSCSLIVIVAFARILAAAHFLSDVSTGATVMVLLLFIANEIIIRIKPLHLETKENPAEEKAE